jgi:PAS domain S-box-containing protein
MMRVFGSAVRWLSRMSIKSQVMLLVVASTLSALGIVGALSYQRSTEQTIAESQKWASAVAMLAAHASTGPVLEHDYGTLDSSLQEIVALPGVESIHVIRPGGEALFRVRHDARGGEFNGPGSNTRPAPPSGPHLRENSHIKAFASLLTSNRATGGREVNFDDFAREGWVEVDFSFAERLRIARHNWMAALAGTSVLIILTLVLFHHFLRRAISPIGALARFSTSLASSPGETLRIRWGSQEVRELGRALNRSSEDLARSISETQMRLTRLKAILDTAADAIIGVKTDGTIDSVNPAAERMFGRAADELRGLPLSDILISMDAATLRKAMDDGMLFRSTQSRVGRVEIDALRHGGTAFQVEVLLGEIPNDEEVRYTCIVRDLTDLKQAEEYLTLYGRVLDCTPNGISISDARSYPQPIVHVNPAFTHITGYKPHEILGRDRSVFDGPETDSTDLATLENVVRAGGETKLTLRNYRKDGSLFHNKVSVSPVRDASDEITHYISVIEDVSSQIEVKQRLIERTARLHATFELSPGGFVLFDAQGLMTACNPAFRNMVGEMPEGCTLDRFDALFRNLCESPETYRSSIEALNDKGKDTFVLTQPTNKVLEREIRRNLGGRGETFMYFRDITERFEVDRIKSEFLATAAHELRTPLASILGFTELMLHRKYSEDKQKDLLQTVHRQGTLLSNLIQELLDLSRIEARQGKDFRIVPTRLAAIVQDAVSGIASDDFNRMIDATDVPDVWVMADHSKIQQALTNLLSNAFKYSPNGGRVSLVFDQTVRNDSNFVSIQVCDQGMGMTPEQVGRAFERFYRADGSGNIPGTGLGLNLVKEIAEIHQGSIELTSEYGVGTVATLCLKVANSESSATSVTEQTEQA